jgi:hypothetical protein
MTSMRAKVRVGSISAFFNDAKEKTGEQVYFHGVAKSSSYPADGSDEDNTFAKFSPSVSMNFTIANPALIGEFEVGDTFYVDFSPVAKPETVAEQAAKLVA